MRSRALVSAGAAAVVAAAVCTVAGCTSTGPEAGGGAGGRAGGASTGQHGIVQSNAHAGSGATWRDPDVSFVLPAGWGVFSGAHLNDDPVAIAGVRAVSSRSGLDAGQFATTLSTYKTVGFGPDGGLVIVTTTPQADQDATTETSVRAYLAALCGRQPTLCERLASFEERSTPQGRAVVYVTVSGGGNVSGSILLPYVARAATASSTRLGRRVSVESASSATVAAAVDAIVASVHQS